MRETFALILLLCAWHIQAATVTNDVVTMTLCSDGLYYSTPTCPNPVLTGSQRFVRNGGSNAASGLTDASAWATPSMCSSLPTGTDCNLKSGSTFTGTSARMVANWPGTATDYAITRCYKISGTEPVECSASDTKPILLGTMDQAKLTAGTEDYTAAKYASEGSSYYGAQYSIGAAADYSEHKYIAIKNQRAQGILIDGGANSIFGPSGTGSLHHVKLTGMTTYNTGNAPVVVTAGVSDLVVRDGDYGYYNTCEMQARMTGTSLTGECNDAGWPGGVILVRGVSRALIENNDIHNGFGEGMNCYNNANAFSVFRGNRVRNILSGGTYSDICSDLVVENNIYIGNRGGSTAIGYASGSGNEWGAGLSIGWEDFNLPNSNNTVRIVWRNNLMVGTGACGDGTVEQAAAAAGRVAEYKVFGNTCVDPVLTGWGAQYATGTNNTTIHAQNNVVWHDLSAAAICIVPAVPVIETFLKNHWSTTPSDPECVGSGDTSGLPGLTVSSYATWQAYAHGNLPTFANAAPTGGSAIKDTCTYLNAPMLTTASYGFAADNIAAVLATTITLANWGLQNVYDANDTLRGSTCSKGAVE